MKPSFSSIAPIRVLFRCAFSSGVMAITFAAGLTLMLGCRCPEPEHPSTISYDPHQAELMKATLDKAQAKKTWTRDDEVAFRRSLANLSPQNRLASALRLAGLINSRAVLFDRAAPKTTPPPMCPCIPKMCDAVAAPPPAAPPPAANVSPAGAPPVTKAK